jgi:hypothetical protein
MEEPWSVLAQEHYDLAFLLQVQKAKLPNGKAQQLLETGCSEPWDFSRTFCQECQEFLEGRESRKLRARAESPRFHPAFSFTVEETRPRPVRKRLVSVWVSSGPETRVLFSHCSYLR